MQALFTTSGPETMLHRLDVRTKMLISTAASIVVILLKSVPALALLVVASAIYMMLTRRWKVMVIAYAAILFMWIAAVICMKIMGYLSPRMAASGMDSLMLPFLRSLVLINTLLAMALSSRIQGILTTLKSLRLPYWLYIPAAVMIRFLPSLVEDVRQIAETVKTKGYSLHPASLLMAPRQTMRLLFVPILFRSLRTSDELGIAAELKGVGYSTSISSFRHQKFSGIDYGLLFLTTALFVASFVINKYTKVASTFM